MSGEHASHHDHHYTVHCEWHGSTASGYEHYSRSHTVSSPPAAALELSADAVFLGDPSRYSPEQLLVVAASSCQLLSFLAVASRARLDVRSYEDDGEAVMPADSTPMHITTITLRPTIHIAGRTSAKQVQRLVELAHRECYIANSLRTTIVVEATIILEA